MRAASLLLFGLLTAVGCGPSERELREQTLSTLNTEADRWDGGKDFATDASDAWGRPVSSTVEKGTLYYNLEVRSSGPDGLPKNTDDLVVRRSKQHAESSYKEEAGKFAESMGEGATTGVFKGVKKGLGIGGEEGNEEKK